MTTFRVYFKDGTKVDHKAESLDAAVEHFQLTNQIQHVDLWKGTQYLKIVPKKPQWAFQEVRG